MGNCLNCRKTVTTELYVDYFVKYVTGLLQLLLGIIALIIVYVGE